MGLILEERKQVSCVSYGNVWFQEYTWLIRNFLNSKKFSKFPYDCKRTTGVYNLKHCVLSFFAMGYKVLSYNLCENRSLTLNCKSNIHHQEYQNQQNRRRRWWTHCQAHFAESGGELFFGFVRVLFITALQTGIIRKQEECVSWIQCIQLDLNRSG